MKRKLLIALSVVIFVSAVLVTPGSAAEPCRHAWENCICTLCGELCLHPGFEDDRCIECGIVCQHFNWRGDTCAFCGARCPHSYWEDGRCTVCGTVCTHPFHDPDTLLCSCCGESAPHEYEDGVCTRCGAAVSPALQEVPQELFSACTEQGTIASLSYIATDYAGGRDLQKNMTVYLPYGYDPSEKYDVLVLLHGMNGTEKYWLVQSQLFQGSFEDGVYTRSLLDNMIQRGLCRPMIVVCPTFYQSSGNFRNYDRYREQTQLGLELRYTVLPLIARTYSTYAADDSQGALIAARDHFGYAGLSMGSIYAYNTILPQNLDLFSWFGCFSGSEADAHAVAAMVDSWDPELCKIHCFFNSAGSADPMGWQQNDEYHTLIGESTALSEGKNAWFQYVDGAGHEYRAWVTGLYNFLQMAFKN